MGRVDTSSNEGRNRRSLQGETEFAIPSPSETDREAVDRWMVETLPRAVAFARSLLHDQSLGDDVVHECYCRLLKKADVYDLKLDGTKLLFKAITNACINLNSRRKPHLSLHAPGPESASLVGRIEDRRETQPRQAALDRELERLIKESLAQLPVTQRAALELKSMGYSHQEIGDALTTSANNVAVLVHRARQFMTKQLAPYLEEKS